MRHPGSDYRNMTLVPLGRARMKPVPVDATCSAIAAAARIIVFFMDLRTFHVGHLQDGLRRIRHG